MSFGESHGSAVGGVIDGCPAGIALSADFIQVEPAAARSVGGFYPPEGRRHRRDSFRNI